MAGTPDGVIGAVFALLIGGFVFVAVVFGGFVLGQSMWLGIVEHAVSPATVSGGRRALAVVLNLAGFVGVLWTWFGDHSRTIDVAAAVSGLFMLPAVLGGWMAATARDPADHTNS